MNRKWLTPAGAAIAALALAGAGHTQDAGSKPQYGAWGFDLTAMDRGVKPGDDFNRYANGAWLARTEIPADKSIASLRYLMSDRIEARLHDLFEHAAVSAGDRPTDLEAKAGAFYKAF